MAATRGASRRGAAKGRGAGKPARKAGGKRHPKCVARGKHRVAQNKYVAKDPKAQVERVKKSAAKKSTKAGTKAATKQASKNSGKNSGKQGRPRKAC